MTEFTDEQLEGLSEEERAALEEQDGEAENDDGVDDGDKTEAEDDKSDDDKSEEEEDGRLKAEEDANKKAVDDEAAARAEAERLAAEDAERKAKEGAGADDGNKGGQPPVPPMFKLEAGTEGKTLESINSELAALDEQLDEGDITVKDYNTKRDALNKIKFQIEMYDDINRQVAVQTVQNIWQASQREFFAENKEYIENPVLNAAYVHVVNGLLASEEGKKMTDRQLLLKAKETVDESLGRTARKGEGDDREKAKRAALAAAKKAEAEKGKGSVSLGNMPLAESQEMGDRFDTLDKLTGEEFENAVAALSESDRQAYGRRV